MQSSSSRPEESGILQTFLVGDVDVGDLGQGCGAAVEVRALYRSVSVGWLVLHPTRYLAPARARIPGRRGARAQTGKVKKQGPVSGSRGLPRAADQRCMHHLKSRFESRKTAPHVEIADRLL